MVTYFNKQGRTRIQTEREEEWEGRLATIKNEVKASERIITEEVNELKKQNKELKKNQQELKDNILRLLDLVGEGQKATP